MQLYPMQDIPWIQIFERNTLEILISHVNDVTLITLYLAVEGDTHVPCMTECKQTAAVFAGRLPQSLASENYYNPEGAIG